MGNEVSSHNTNDYDKHDLSVLALYDLKPKKTYKKITSSNVSREWLKSVSEIHNCDIQYSQDNQGTGEVSIVGPNKYKIYFDGFCKTTNTVYEFHGCKVNYHGCPYCNILDEKSLAILERTLKKEKFILDSGYKLFRIWEHEYRNIKRGNTLSLGIYVDSNNHNEIRNVSSVKNRI